MKSLRLLPLVIIAALFFQGCSSSESTPKNEYTELNYTHYSSGGTPEEYTGVILFEQACSTFTAYQVAFASCTCRDPLVAYYSVCYVEILNTKQSAKESAIRTITFGNNMGLYGDSNPNYYIAEYTQEYMDENFVQHLVGTTKSDFDGWEGYRTQLTCVDADAVSGASVTTGNVTSMLKSLFAYHAAKYYGEES